MPPEHGLGLDYKEVLAPAPWPKQANPDPKDSISISEAMEAMVGVGAQDDVELMAGRDSRERGHDETLGP